MPDRWSDQDWPDVETASHSPAPGPAPPAHESPAHEPPAPAFTEDLGSDKRTVDRIGIRVVVDERAPAEEVAEELANFYRLLNEYHIAVGGSGLRIEDWKTKTRDGVKAGV